MKTETDKLQVTFIPEQKNNTGKMFFWLPPRDEEFSLKEILKTITNFHSSLSFQEMKTSLVLPPSWVYKRKSVSKIPKIFTVQGKALSIIDSLVFLSNVDNGDSPYKKISSSLKIWSLAAKFVLELVTRGQIIPTLEPQSKDSFKALWKVSLWMESDRQRFLKLAQAMPLAGHALPYKEKDKKREISPSIYSSKSILQKFLDETADTLVRESFRTRKGKNQEILPEFYDDTWNFRLLASLISSDSTFYIKGFSERHIPETLKKWLKPVTTPRKSENYRICFRLDTPSDSEMSNKCWRINYLLQAVDDPSLLIPAEKVWKTSSRELKFLNRTFKEPQEKILTGLAEASRIFPPLIESLKVARPSYVNIDINEVWNFISESAPILQQSGFGIILPEEFTQAGQRRIKARIRIGSKSPKKESPIEGTGKFSLPSLVDYQWEVALGKETLSISEFKRIAALKQPLVHWRGHWVIVDPEEIARVKKLFDKTISGKLRIQEALAAVLLEKKEDSDLETSVEVVPTGNMKALLDFFKSRKNLKSFLTPRTFRGKLRNYQKKGLMWLTNLTKFGFGACLADDMGLGKTIQVIAWLLYQREENLIDSYPTLIICPTSVLGNWEREIERFAPSLPVIRHHGLNRARSKESLEKNFLPHIIVLTTYALARRDREFLSKIEWANVILDEAQNIKNPFSQQARAIRRFKAKCRVALTGTPIENRLSELWSIFEFLNPGFLGPLKSFKTKIALPVERYKDLEATSKLKKLTGPFLLRRVKTDKSIISDLPEKNEMKVFCTLTKEQATLYQALLNETMKKIEKEEGIKRRGIVLSLIMSLKQICNHPSLYLKESGPLPGRSGKLERLSEMCEEVVEGGDRALIFTQFREMGYLLVRYLEKKMGIQVPFLHGGVPSKKREEMIYSFQKRKDSPPIFLLSLKAGGTGLNLARANFVFHFDRWWNPAVENQATDRTFRIGQKRNVQVYKMVCLGTMEEKIDKMLEEKSELLERVVSPGEKWITEMSNDELYEVLSLSREATVDLEEK